MGWESLAQWGDDAVRVERLVGGVANDVWSVRIDGMLAVGRLGTRSDADLAWETDLLVHLDREGLAVPTPISTLDGRLYVDGLVVMTYLEGGPPASASDWSRVADALRTLHRLTAGRSVRAGGRPPTCCARMPVPGSTSALCLRRASRDVGPPGRELLAARQASCTATRPTPATSS